MAAALPGPCDAGVAGATRPAACGHPGLTLAATILGSSVAFIDGSVVNVALPALQAGLDASAGQLAWTINAYLLPLGALTLLGGGLGDHFGRRRLFLTGLSVFAAASLLCLAAPGVGWLLAGRALQGLGAALLMPNSLAILGAAFAGEARGRAIGTWAATGALAGAVGPLLGGWLVDVAGWRTIFLINLPVAAGAALLAWRYVAESGGAEAAGPLDWAGAALATLALGLLTWALTEAGAAGWSLPVLATATLGALALALFLRAEARAGAGALMPLALFATRSFVGLTLFTFLLYGALGGLLVLLPYVLIHQGQYSAVAAGAALLPLPVLIGLGSRLMGRLTAQHGGRLPLALGAALVALGLAFYLRIGAGTLDYWRDVLPATLLVSFGMAVSVAPLTTSVMAAADPEHVGAASGFNSAVARVGGLVATALLGFVLAAEAAPERFLAGVHGAALVGAGCAALAAGCIAWGLRRT